MNTPWIERSLRDARALRIIMHFTRFDFNQSVTSPMHISEAPEVTSAPNIQSEVEGLLFHEDDSYTVKYGKAYGEPAV